MRIIFIWLLILGLTIYAPGELTLAIVNQGIELRLWPEIPVSSFLWEIGLMWAGYVLAMVVIFGLLVVLELRDKFYKQNLLKETK